MSETTAFLLGIIQGITEWIPVSSQGIVALVSTWIDDASPSDAIAIALWLHVGTALSATIALRRDITSMIRDSIAAPAHSKSPPGHSALLAAHPELASVDPELLEGLPPGHPEPAPSSPSASQGHPEVSSGHPELASVHPELVEGFPLTAHAGTRQSNPTYPPTVIANFGRRHCLPPVIFLALSTVVTSIIGLPLYLIVGEIADLLGSVAMLLIGLAMLATAFVIRCGLWQGERGREDVTPKDAIIVGVAQALAVVPGISRTGMTVAVLLARDCSHREAVVLSVLMGIPASIGAGLLALNTSDMIDGWPAVVAIVTAAIVGTAAIRAILSWTTRVTLAPFVAAAGIAVILGALIGLLP